MCNYCDDLFGRTLVSLARLSLARLSLARLSRAHFTPRGEFLRPGVGTACRPNLNFAIKFQEIPCRPVRVFDFGL